MNKYQELANLIFPDVNLKIEDLERKYPKRNLDEGAIVSRFAPSPTGFLHSGSLFATLIDWISAKQSNGIFYVRLEDTDTKREIEGSGETLLKELEAFNILPNEGYFGTYEKGEYGPYKQSERAEIYKIVIKELIERGDAYPCFCSQEELAELRKTQEAKKENPGYYGEYARCSYLSPDEAIEKIKAGIPYVIRFRSHGDYHNKVHVVDMVRGELDLSENDQHIVIYKSDGLPTYHFAHLVDDHFMRTTHVIRGEEWLASLPIHVELFERMGWIPPKYVHVPVIMKLDNGSRRKLSKRKDPEAAVSYFFEKGYPTEGFLEYLLTIANSNFEEWRLQNMSANAFDFKFSFSNMTLDGALFDLAKIENICKERLSRLSKEEITRRAYEYGLKYEPRLSELIDRDKDYFMSIMNIEREKENPRKDYVKFSDIFPIVSFFYDDYYNELFKEELPFNETISKDVIIKVLEAYKNNKGLDLSEEEWFNNLKEIASSLGFAPTTKDYKKNREAYVGSIGDLSEIIRIAISTRKNTPNPYYVLKILGEDKINERFNKVIERLNK